MPILSVRGGWIGGVVTRGGGGWVIKHMSIALGVGNSKKAGRSGPLSGEKAKTS